jgi:hypothetical protein
MVERWEFLKKGTKILKTLFYGVRDGEKKGRTRSAAQRGDTRQVARKIAGSVP